MNPKIRSTDLATFGQKMSRTASRAIRQSEVRLSRKSRRIQVHYEDLEVRQVLSTTISPLQAKTAIYEGVESLVMPQVNSPYYIGVADASLNAATVIDTVNGSLVGLAKYNQGRVAVIGETNVLNQGLLSDPANDSWARSVFNLYSWLSDTSRTVGQTDKLYVLRASDWGVHSSWNVGIPENQSLFTDYIAGETSYNATHEYAATVTGLLPAFTNAGTISEALMPDGAWTRHYGVVEIPSNVDAGVINLVKQWMTATGGGVIIDCDTNFTISTDVRSFVNSLGLSINATAGPNMASGDYTPTKVDPKSTDVVFKQLTGVLPGTFGQSSSSPILIQDSIKLPSEIMGAKVTWSTSDSGTLSATGVAGADGTATLTAHLVFEDGTTQDQSIYYQLFHPTAGTGLQRRIIDVSGYTVNGSTPSDTDINAFMDSTLLSQTPLSAETVFTTNWSSSTDSWPTVGYNQTLWTFSGYLMPTETGSYSIKLAADDSAKLFIEHDGQITSQTAVYWGNGTQTVTLEAGKTYRIWLFFKPSAGGVNNVSLQWQAPGSASYVTVPSSALGQFPSGLLPSNGGYPTALLPWGNNPSSSNKTTTQIISDSGLTTLWGNQTPTVANQQFNLQKNGLYFDPQNIRFTDAVAAQAKTVTLRALNPDGTTSFFLNNVLLGGVTDGASLASAIQSLVDSANAASGSTGTVTVSYVNNLLTVTDTASRKMTDFILTKQSSDVLTVNSTPDYAVVGEATVGFDLNNVFQATRLSFSLAANANGPAVGLADLMFQGVGYGDPANLAPFLQNAVRGVMGNSDVTITWNPDSTGSLTGNLVFTDAKGRSFSDLKLTNQSRFIPLVEMAGPSRIGAGASSIATIGGISGRAFASDANGDTYTFRVLEAPKFGSVTLNAATGEYFYQPTADGSFQGFDQFTLQVTDGLGAISKPFSVTITNEEAPQVAVPVVKTYTIPDPVYNEPVANPSVNLPADWEFKDVFIAQTHVQRPSDPYLELTQNRYALIKLNGISPSGSAAPDFTVYVTDSQGNTVGSLRLTGPANLPTSVNLPSMDTFGVGMQTDADSYTAPLPGAWIKPGMKITIMATGSNMPITTFSPKVGSDLNLNLSLMSLSMHGINDGAYMSGIANWAQQALVNLPAGSITVYQYPYLNINSFGKEQSGVWGTYTGDNSGLPGSDPLMYDGGFQGVIGYAIHLAGQLRAANGRYSSIVYVADHPEPGGGLGGGSIGGGGPSPGIFWHEVMGHGEGRGHAATDPAYPYNNVTPTGSSTQNGWLGPNWGYNQITGQYQPTSVVNADGTISLYTDPQAGGWQDRSNTNFGMFSDYYSYLNHQYMNAQTQWVPDTTIPDATGDGAYQYWDSTNLQWVTTPQSDPNTPIEHDVPVYWLSMNLTTPQGSGASPGSTYAENLRVLPVRTIGNLSQPFHDIVTGTGRSQTDGNYVARVTYSTPTGLIIDNLVIPSYYGTMYVGFNVPDKGELVRVDIVEAAGADLNAYLENKVVASYVNSNALANLIFKGDPTFSASNSLNLPSYFNGAKIDWSSTIDGLVDLNTGTVDGSKLSSGAAIKAQWMENGVLQTQTFLLNLPDSYQVMRQLFGKTTDMTSPVGYYVVNSNLILPSTVFGASVSWSSSNPAVITNTGQILGQGATYLKATVTYPNGAVLTYGMNYFAQPEASLTRSNPYVMYQLFGQDYKTDTVTDPRFVSSNLILPSTIDHGTVTWSSSNTEVLSNSGQVVRSGQATLTATVTFDDASTHNYSVVYNVQSEYSLNTRTEYVMNELFGSPLSSDTITEIKVVTSDLTLPGTVEHGSVVWSSSNTSVISNTGQLLGFGTATIMATVTYSDGTSHTYSRLYYAEPGIGIMTSTGYVMNQLFGTAYNSNHVTDPLIVSTAQTLPATIHHGMVAWTTSNPSILSATGEITGAGSATLTATVTFDNGYSGTYSRDYFVAGERYFTTTLPYVMNELFGTAYTSSTVADPKLIFADLTLPTTINHGTVAWSSSNTAVINNSGQLVGSGLATLTATVTFDDSTTRTYSVTYYAMSEQAAALATPYVMNQLFGYSYSQANLTDTKMINSALSLPATVDHGTVVWSSSNTSILSDTGVPITTGLATLTATVTFDNSSSRTYSRPYYSVVDGTGLTTGGLLFRAVDATGFKSIATGTTPSDPDINAFLSSELTSKTPLVSTTNQYPNWNQANGIPTGLANGTSLKTTLWSYTGFVLPAATGTYQFNVKADDGVKLYIMKDGVISSVSAIWSDASGQTLSIDLTAGKAYPIWIYYHGSPNTGPNNLAVTWKSPTDSSFVNIPASQLAGTPSSLVSDTSGVANGLLPFEATMDSFNSGLGLQVRVIDLTGFSYASTASGMDKYIAPDVLGTTPIFSGTSLPKWSRPTGYNGSWATYVPSVLRNASGYIKDSLWVYSGFFVAKTDGSYQFKITADDNGRLYMGEAGSTQKVDKNGTITMTLTAGQTVPMWVYYKNVDPTSQDATYWPDSINVQYMKPGDASFSDIPADRLAPMPDVLVPPNAGYPTAQQPKITSANPFDTGVGLNLRVVDLTNYIYTNTASGMDHYLTADILGQTPIWSGSAVPNYYKGVAVYGNVTAPDAIRNASGQVKESLWTYSGYMLPEVSGSYTLRLAADDDARMYIGQPGSVQKVNNNGTITLNLTAGQVVPVWVFYKSGAADSYWADWVKLDWILPGAGSYTDIPADRFAPMPDSMLPANAGYSTSQLPFALGDDAFRRGTGLQFRVIDLTGYSDNTGVSGFDKWLTPAVLDQTPIFSGTMSPYWTKGDPLPAAVKSANGYAKDSFWAFTGYILPEVTGTYGISFTADDYGRMYIGQDGQVQTIYHEVNGGGPGTINISMTAGVPVPITVFFKTQPPDGYWSDWVQVQWKLPGASSYTTIPSDRFAPVSDSLISPTGRYPQSMIPKLSTANPFDTGLGLNLRVVDLTSVISPNTASGIYKYLTPEVLDLTPIYSGVALPNYLKGVGVYSNVTVPDALRDSNRLVKESLWTYSGYILPKTSGNYTFRLTADDAGVAYIGQPGNLQQLTPGDSNVITMNLTAGQVVPVWIFFKTGAPDSYWADQIKLDWTLPGESAYSDIPKENLAPLPDSLLPANAGYPAGQMPYGAYDHFYNLGNGLQLRVVDLTGYSYVGTASGMDRYLTADVMGQTPIYTGVALPNYFKDVAAYGNVDVPNALRDASGFVKTSLWSYSGYILPKTTGTYTFQLSADDGARVYIGKPGEVQSADSYVQGSAATVTMNLTAGDVIPVWVFFQSGPPDSYWADWVTLKWQTPGSGSFTDIPANQLSPISDTLVAPNGGYPASLLPFVLNPTLSVASTQATPNATFLAVSSAMATVLPLTASSKTVSDQTYVSGGHFTQQITVPTAFGNANMTRWVKLLVKQADGTIAEQDPIQPWTTSVSGTTMTVKGVIDSTPGIVLTGVKVYADDNSFDNVAPATATININNSPGTVTLSANSVMENQAVGTTVGTLSVTGSNGTDTFTYSIVPSTNHTGDSTFFSINGNVLKTQRVFDTSVKNSYTLRLRATNAAGFSTESDVTITIVKNLIVTPAATFLVTSTADTNTTGTLRWAMAQANAFTTGSSVVRFDPSVFGTAQTINITSALPNIDNTSGYQVSIVGPGSSLLTINGGGAGSNYRAFYGYNYGTKLAVSGMTITNFRRTSDGGAIKSYGQLTVDDVVFANNSAPGYYGAAIYSEGSNSVAGSGNLTVTNCSFTGNNSDYGAALASYNSGVTAIKTSTFSGNTAIKSGGAIWVATTRMTLENVTVSQNTSLNGGGIYNKGGTGTELHLVSSTIANNIATASTLPSSPTVSAGGLQTVNDASTVKIYDSIIANNTANGTPSDIVGQIDGGTSNLIGSGTNMTGLINGSSGNKIGTAASPIDPLLGTLANNGGTTKTLALLTGSPAIDAGDASAIATDQRGTARTQGARADIGAYELVMSNAAPAITSQPANTSVNTGSIATFIVSGRATPAATFQWYLSTNKGVSWSAISGETNPTYSFTTSLADNGNQYRAVLTNSIGSITSAAATLTLNYSPTVSSQPNNQRVNAFDTAVFRVGNVANPNPAIQWQVNSGSGWSDITGATTDYLLITAASGDNSNQYRAVLTNSVGSVITSAATLTVNSAPAVTTQPVNASVNPGNAATFTTAASGTPAPTVQWQVNNGSGWADISGATSLTYTTAATVAGDNGALYRAVFTNSLGTVTTSAATLTVTINGSNSAPTDLALSNASIAENAGANVNVGTLSTTDPDAGNTFTYTLVSGTGSDDNAAFIISGNTLQALASFDYETKSSYTVRVRSTDQGGLYTEKAFTISVTNVNETPTNIALSANSVTPANMSGAALGTLSTTDPDAGNTFTFTMVTGTGDTDNASFTIVGSELRTLPTVNYSSKSSYSVLVRSTDQGGLFTEKSFTISSTVTAPSVTTQPSNSTVLSGSTASFTVAASGNPTPTVQWQVNSGSGWSDISGATSLTYTTPVTVTGDNGTQYRAVFTSSVGTATTDPATLTVNSLALPSITLQPSDAWANIGGQATFIASASSSASPTIQWQFSTDLGSNWSDISGATGLTFTTDTLNLSQNGYQYRAQFANSLGSVTTQAALLRLTSTEVTTTRDDSVVVGGISLRQAMEYATTQRAGESTLINFANSVTGTITLGSSLPNLSVADTSVLIFGPGADLLTLKGGGIGTDYGLLNVDSRTEAQIYGLTISEFHSTSNGSGIFSNRGGSLSIVDSTILHNTASGANGGAIYNAGVTEIIGTTLEGNSADSGGAIYNTGRLLVSSSTFIGNTASAEGGAILNTASGKIAMTFATVANNTAVTGGGMSNQGGVLNLLNSIVANNSASSSGPDIAGSASSKFSLIGESSGASIVGQDNILDQNALFGPSGLYGGSTKVLPLLPGSPAIDSGRGMEVTDQRGITVEGKADMGAFQSRGFILTPTSGDNQIAMIGDSFTNPLSLSVSSPYSEPVEGGSVSFFATTGAGAPSAVISGSSTISGGSVQVQATANANYGTVAGESYQVVARTSGAANAASYRLQNVGTPATVILTSGNGQSGPLNSDFAEQLAVKVVDSLGNPIPNQSISLGTQGTAYGANGTINSQTSLNLTTDSTGSAGGVVYHSNGIGGLVQVQATASVTAVAGIRSSTSVQATFELGSVDLQVQNGTVGRSFINAVSAIFGDPSLASDLTSRSKIQYLGYRGDQTPVDVSYQTLQASGNQINWGFGANGITGSRTTDTGDGVYQLAIDYNLDGIYETTAKFHRLFGDVNGDAVVDNADVTAIRAVLNRNGIITGADIDGSGRVDNTDLLNTTRKRGRRVIYQPYA